MILVPDIYDFIRNGDIPEQPGYYTDATWYCVKLSSRHPLYQLDPCLCLFEALPKQVPAWKTPSLAKLASALEHRADTDRVPIVISVAIGRLGAALAGRGYRQQDPQRPPSAQQTWLRDAPDVAVKDGIDEG